MTDARGRAEGYHSVSVQGLCVILSISPAATMIFFDAGACENGEQPCCSLAWLQC